MQWRKGFDLRRLPSKCVFRAREEGPTDCTEKKNDRVRSKVDGEWIGWKKSLCYEICDLVINANSKCIYESPLLVKVDEALVTYRCTQVPSHAVPYSFPNGPKAPEGS